MVESFTSARGRAPRPAPNAARPPRTALTTAARRCVDAAEAAGGGGEETAALQAMLLERTEQVERLEALVSEKRLLQRRDEALEERVRHYEEQLAQLATILKGDTSVSVVKTAATTSSKASAEKRQNATLGASTNRLGLSLGGILDDALQLRYEKCRMESELGKKEAALSALREELKQVQAEGNVGEVSLEKCSVDVSFSSIISSTQPSRKAEVLRTDETIVAQHEHKLTEAQEKHRRVEMKLESYKKEYYALRQRLRDCEKEVLKWQRQYQEAVETRAKQPQSIFLTQWKTATRMVSSRHCIFFRGADWVQLSSEKPEAMRNAFLNDVSLELGAPRGFVTVAEMRTGPDTVAVDVDVRHPDTFAEKQVELCVMECPFRETGRLLEGREGPKEGWDMVQEQLNETRKLIAEKETEVTRLQERLNLAEALLQQQRDERDEGNELAHRTLDETEETLTVMYSEIQDQREKRRQLQERLQEVTEALATRDQTLEELRIQLQEAKRQEERIAQQLVEVEGRGRKEQPQKTAPRTHVVSYSFPLERSVHDNAIVAALDSKANDILRALVLGEVAVAAKAVPLKILSLTCTGKEVRAEVQLQVDPLAASVVKDVQSFWTPASALFMEEWFAMKSQADIHARRTGHPAEELSCFQKTFATDDTPLSPVKHVARLAAALKEMEKSKSSYEQLWRKERSRVQVLETEHQQLQQEYAASQDRFSAQAQQLMELQMKRRCLSDGVAEAAQNRVELERDVIAALRRSYEECDDLHKTLDASIRQQHAMEKSLREKLHEREGESEGLRSQIAVLQKELRAQQLALATAKSDHHRSGVERDEFIKSMEQETQMLSKRLARNDDLRREMEAAKKALETQVTQLQQRCVALESERRKLEERSALLEKDSTAQLKKMEELQSEMASRNQRAEEMMQQLVLEEDARRAAEVELVALRRSKTACASAHDEDRKAIMPGVKRLRNFCVHTLNLPLTEKQQTLGDIVAFMELHHKSAVTEKEDLTAVLSTMATVSQLLRQCVATTEEFKDGLTRESPASIYADKKGGANSNGTGSRDCSSRVGRLQQSARVLQLSGERSKTPKSLERSSGGGHAQPRQRQQQHELEIKRRSTLAGSAAEILGLAQSLSKVVTHWRDELTQKSTQMDELSKKFGDLSDELNRIQLEVLKREQNESSSDKLVDTASTGKGDVMDHEFLRRSRAHALCVVLSVKDHLHDALTTLRPAAVFREGNSTVCDGASVDTPNSLRTAEKCVVGALRHMMNSVSVIFSPKERQAIETRRGADYFVAPAAWDDAAGSSTSRTRSPPVSPVRRCGERLLSPDPNTPGSSPILTATMRERPRCGLRDVTDRTYGKCASSKEQILIPRARKETRCRNR